MKQKTVAAVGFAETTELGKIPNMSQIQLHADAALNALADCGLKPSDIDGVATAGLSPTELAYYLGITPTWADGTSVGGCSFMLHVRHAAAAINEGLCTTVLITHGESGRSRVGGGGRFGGIVVVLVENDCLIPQVERGEGRIGLSGCVIGRVGVRNLVLARIDFAQTGLSRTDHGQARLF